MTHDKQMWQASHELWRWVQRMKNEYELTYGDMIQLLEVQKLALYDESAAIVDDGEIEGDDDER